jgi:transcriptional regulator with XRE-family HTH domain
VAVNAIRDPQIRTDYTADQLRVALAKLGLSGRELARRLNVSPNWVSLRTTGQQSITPEDAVLIAEGLDISLSDLIGTPPNRTPRRRLAPVLGDVQDFIDEVATDHEKQFLLKSIRGLLNMTIEAHQGVTHEPTHAERQRRR